MIDELSRSSVSTPEESVGGDYRELIGTPDEIAHRMSEAIRGPFSRVGNLRLGMILTGAVIFVSGVAVTMAPLNGHGPLGLGLGVGGLTVVIGALLSVPRGEIPQDVRDEE